MVKLSKHVNLVAHADWSANVQKRWLVIAHRQPDDSWIARSPLRVRNPRELLPDLQASAGRSGCTLVGFDFPIGLPEAYARQAAVSDFLELLPVLGHWPWADFYQVAAQPEQIDLHRPFYPLRPAGTKRSHLVHSLGMDTFDDLRRRCERAHPNRRAASPLFWTLGGQQVGKAAISGWKDVLVPGLLDKNTNLVIWPFSGPLGSLLRPGAIVAAETYPAEAYRPIGIRFKKLAQGGKAGKRSQAAREENARILLGFARQAGVILTPELEAQILAGFGPRLDGEDRFDALVGLLWMLHWLGKPDFPEPKDRMINRLEGWIFGQQYPACP